MVPWSRAELRYLARRTWSSASPPASTRVCMRVGASQMRRGSGSPSQFRQARARPGTSATRTPPPGSLSPSEEMAIHPVAGTSTQHRGRVSSCRYSYRTQWRHPWLLAYYVTPPSGCGLRSDGKWKLADVLLGPDRRAFPSEARYCIVRNVHFGTEYRHDSDEPQVSIKRRAIHTYFFKITSRHHGARGRRPGPPIDPVLSSPAPECPFPSWSCALVPIVPDTRRPAIPYFPRDHGVCPFALLGASPGLPTALSLPPQRHRYPTRADPSPISRCAGLA